MKWGLWVQAIIFDFDGTILDTESAEYQSWHEIYQQYGAELPIGEWARAVGTVGGFDAMDFLERSVGRALDREAIFAERRRRDQELIAASHVRPGVRELIAEARAEGIRLAVATSSSVRWVSAHLERLGLRESFGAVCTFDDTGVAKPDPAIYLLALHRLGVPAAEAVAVEDSPNGMLAAQAAGIFCLVVPNPITQNFDFPHPDAMRATLADVRVADIRRMLRARRRTGAV